MSKTLIVGDMHCKQKIILPLVDEAVSCFEPSRVIFLGDYVDEWNTTAKDVIDALDVQARWIRSTATRDIEVILVLGNHDFEYLLGEGCSGTHLEAMDSIRELLGQFKMRAAISCDGHLITHAGVTEEWRNEYAPRADNIESLATRINEMYFDGSYYDWRALASCGPSRGGCELPSPLWADKRDLQADAASRMNQIVGHTPVETCMKLRSKRDDIWLCDTFSLTGRMQPVGDGSMLVVENGVAERIRTNWLDRWEHRLR